VGELVDSIIAWLSANQEIAGPALGALCLFLCLGIVGILVTAPPVLVAVGGLVAAGSLNAYAMIGWAALGAFVGFIITYYAGRWLGPGVVHRWPLKNYRRAVARSRLLFRRYASLAVFFCRFFGPLRCTIPLIAGITGMNQHRFMIANALSALAWAIAFMAPGWIAVRGMAELETLGEAHWLSITVAGLALAGVIVAVGFRLQRARLERQRLRKRRIAARRAPGGA
jgi:membrane protein DedA with SNARE-associated domain